MITKKEIKIINDFFDEWKLDIKFKETMKNNLLNKLTRNKRK